MTRYPDTALTRAVTGPDLPIIVSLARHDMGLAEAAADAGAVALKLHLNAYHRSSGTTFGSFTEERAFFREAAALGKPLLVMAGQETVPTACESDEMADLGVEGFNIYVSQMQPHLLQSRLRPIPALSADSDAAALKEAAAIPGAWIEASITEFADYGTALTPEDIARYAQIVDNAGVPIIAPSQKRLIPANVPALRRTGLAALLLGVVVTGDTQVSVSKSVAQMVDAVRRSDDRLHHPARLKTYRDLEES